MLGSSIRQRGCLIIGLMSGITMLLVVALPGWRHAALHAALDEVVTRKTEAATQAAIRRGVAAAAKAPRPVSIASFACCPPRGARRAAGKTAAR